MNYNLLPFKYIFKNENVLLTNYVGDFIWVTQEDFEKLLSGTLEASSELFNDLKSIYIISSGNSAHDIDILSVKYRSKKNYLSNFTNLHMVVTTLRCNQHCYYCQATAESRDSGSSWDMKKDTALLVAEKIMQSPSDYLTVEFQGGESTLNFEGIKTVVERIFELNSKSYPKSIDFVICTNLYNITDEMLDYIRYRDISISTSLDGPAYIHDKYRVGWMSEGTHKLVIDNIQRVRSFIGNKIGVLMTMTKDSISNIERIVDEYLEIGLSYIFFRSLNPYGRCIENYSTLSYPIEDFLKAYEKGLRYIIDLNKKGYYIREGYSSLLLKRMLTPFSTGFVDLQSPSGAAISGVIYNYNGNIYCCDEGRMLSAMGDEFFCMGNVKDEYDKLFNSPLVHTLVENSILDTIPECTDCVYKCWCGADPVRQYAINKRLISRKSNDDFCKKHKTIFSLLLDLLNEDDNIRKILWNWAWESKS